MGTELRQLLQVGRAEQLRRITADILPDNRAMQGICRQLGFQLHRSLNQPVKAVIEW
jgi:acetyltransferase